MQSLLVLYTSIGLVDAVSSAYLHQLDAKKVEHIVSRPY